MFEQRLDLPARPLSAPFLIGQAEDQEQHGFDLAVEVVRVEHDLLATMLGREAVFFSVVLVLCWAKNGSLACLSCDPRQNCA